MAEALDACAECGAGLERVSGPDAGPAVFACRACGHRVYVEVNPAVPPEAPAPPLRLVVEWTGPASARVVHALRRVDPKLARRPTGEVLAHLRQRQTWDLGVRAQGLALALESRCRRAGLAVIRRPATADEMDRSELPAPPSQRVDRGIPIHFAWIVLAAGALLGATALLLLR